MPGRRKVEKTARPDDGDNDNEQQNDSGHGLNVTAAARVPRKVIRRGDGPHGAAPTAASTAGVDEWEDVADSDDAGGDASDSDDDSEYSVDERYEDMVEEDIYEEGEEDEEDFEDDDGEAGEGGAAGALAGLNPDDMKALQEDFGKKVKFNDNGDFEGGDDGEGGQEGTNDMGQVYRPELGSTLQEGQTLDFNNRAYDCFFRLKTEYPVLSFDVMKDVINPATDGTRYPMKMTFVAGSEAPNSNENHLCVIQVSNLTRTRHDGTGDESCSEDDMFGATDSDDDENQVDAEAEEINDGEAVVHAHTVPFHGSVNRVRCHPEMPHMVAAWSGAGCVQVFNLESEYRKHVDFANWTAEQATAAMKGEVPGGKNKKGGPLFISPRDTHKDEGYALDWSPKQVGVFGSGDVNGQVFTWTPTEDGRWVKQLSTPRSAHRMVEEIQWSPTQAPVFVACRAQGDVEIYDTRAGKMQLKWRADETDINVASWNRTLTSSHLIATGAEGGAVTIWDLRQIAQKKEKSVGIQTIKYHVGMRIAAVEFSQHNETVLAVTADDTTSFSSRGRSQCTLWDLSLERDESEEQEVMGELFGREDVQQLPDQLMFQHQGLCAPKEVHWHTQFPGMALVSDYEGIHLFKPRNWRSLMR